MHSARALPDTDTDTDAGPAGPPDPSRDPLARTIHVAQWGTRPAGGGNAPLVLQGAMGLAAVSLLLASRVLRSIGLPTWAVWGITAAGILAVVTAAVIWLVAWFRRNRRIGGPSMTTDERYRVRLVGRPDKTEALLPETADSFEPVVVFAWLGVPPSRAGGRLWAAVSLGVFLLWLHFGQSPPLSVRLDYWGVAACIGIGALAAALATPAYFRVVPGRLDVMRFNFLRSRKPTLESYDLCTNRVLVDARSRVIVVEPPPAEPPAAGVSGARRAPAPKPLAPGSLLITLTCLPGASELARAVLRGAVCVAPAPPVPDDELVG